MSETPDYKAGYNYARYVRTYDELENGIYILENWHNKNE